MKKKIIATLLTGVLMGNVVLPAAALAAKPVPPPGIDANYNPFEDETKAKNKKKNKEKAEVKEEKLAEELPEAEVAKMPFSKRLAYRKAIEEKKKALAKEQKATKQEANSLGAEQQAVPGVKQGNLYIPKGTKLKVELIEAANSKKMQQYQSVGFRTLENLIINGVVVIPKDTVCEGYVYHVAKASGMGAGGQLLIAGKEIKTINGVTVPLRQGLQGKGKSDALGAMAVFSVFSILGGILMKGRNVDFPAGTDFEVEVRSNVDLECTQDNLATVMDPTIPQAPTGQALTVVASN